MRLGTGVAGIGMGGMGLAAGGLPGFGTGTTDAQAGHIRRGTIAASFDLVITFIWIVIGVVMMFAGPGLVYMVPPLVCYAGSAILDVVILVLPKQRKITLCIWIVWTTIRFICDWAVLIAFAVVVVFRTRSKSKKPAKDYENAQIIFTLWIILNIIYLIYFIIALILVCKNLKTIKEKETAEAINPPSQPPPPVSMYDLYLLQQQDEATSTDTVQIPT